MMKVYLAGPIGGLNYEGATEWRDAVRSYGEGMETFDALDPMRGKEYLNDGHILQGTGYNDTLLSNDRAIVTRDRMDVRNCDVLLVNLTGATRVSIGTMFEMAWADADRKPIVTIMEPGNLHDHGFVKQVSSFLVETLDEALAVLDGLAY